ncbi:hypothetical protein COK73_16830 [Bacillus cereus]|uniref:hypothetical protein n=1 Tax=Bacillus cereus TaxID=1396 RepID=UPI000BF88E75|nr:hypothetical protein [Bacillus cereus]PFT69336.1 hypothetical protein COK73_16830 [Bacillus cereus]
MINTKRVISFTENRLFYVRFLKKALAFLHVTRPRVITVDNLKSVVIGESPFRSWDVVKEADNHSSFLITEYKKNPEKYFPPNIWINN